MHVSFLQKEKNPTQYFETEYSHRHEQLEFQHTSSTNNKQFQRKCALYTQLKWKQNSNKNRSITLHFWNELSVGIEILYTLCLLRELLTGLDKSSQD